MWVIAVLVESAIIAVGIYRTRVQRAKAESAFGAVAVTAGDSGPTLVGLVRTNPRADSALDSAMAHMNQLLADSTVQAAAESVVVGLGRAVTTSLILAAIILLPIPLVASAVTVRWAWIRTRDHGRSLLDRRLTSA
jgi:hypothetical protein